MYQHSSKSTIGLPRNRAIISFYRRIRLTNNDFLQFRRFWRREPHSYTQLNQCIKNAIPNYTSFVVRTASKFCYKKSYYFLKIRTFCLINLHSSIDRNDQSAAYKHSSRLSCNTTCCSLSIIIFCRAPTIARNRPCRC
jgi:hypothetical protein